MPFAVEHSLRAPSVGNRITAGNIALFYASDLMYIHRRQAALKKHCGLHRRWGDNLATVYSLSRQPANRPRPDRYATGLASRGRRAVGINE